MKLTPMSIDEWKAGVMTSSHIYPGERDSVHFVERDDGYAITAWVKVRSCGSIHIGSYILKDSGVHGSSVNNHGWWYD